MKFFVIILSLLLSGVSSFSQNVDVDPYTGRALVNVPLLQVNDRSLTHTVGLAYDASGLKVDARSGGVGLNWSLIAGGSVRRELRGLPDDLNESTKKGWLYSSNASTIGSHTYSADGTGLDCDDENTEFNFIDAFSDSLDTEPDIFHFNGAPLEALILTHPHDDHYAGAEFASRMFSVNHYYDPGFPKNTGGYVAFLDSMKGTGGTRPRARNIHIGKQNFGTINWGAELKVEVLYSWEGDPDNVLGSGNTEVNNSSIVLRVQYGDHVFLFMGDAEGKDRDDSPDVPKYVEKILLETVPDKLKATVLKVAHHGSETSSTMPFIEAVDPDVVVVQSGRKSFGGTYLPDLSTLNRYTEHNRDVKIYRTDQGDAQAGYTGRQAVDGDHVVIRTNGRGVPEVSALDGSVAVHGLSGF